MSVITLQQYKEYAGINNPNEDAKLSQLVDYVNVFIERYCNTKFVATPVVDRVLTTSTNEIIIPEAPVISVEEVNLVDLNGVATPVTNYYTELELGIINLAPTVYIPQNTGNVKISYTYGYDGAPAGLLVPAMEFVHYLFKREFIKSRANNVGESVTYLDPAVVPVQVRAGLDLYRML